MQVIFFYNIVYVYVCKIGEEKVLGTVGCRFHCYVNPTQSSNIRTVSVTVPTNPLDNCFSSVR